MNELTNQKWYTSKEMCEMNNVSIETLKNFNETFNGVTDYLIKKGGYRNRENLYSEKALKQFQLWLMRNQTNQGRGSEMVTTKQLAEVLGVSERTIRNVADSKGLESTFLPFETSGGIQKKRAFNEEQATLIKQEIQGHHNLQSRQIDNVSTDLEMEMLTQKVMQYHIQKAQSLQQEVNKLSTQNTHLIEENKEIRAIADGHKELRQNAVASKTEALSKAAKLDYRLKKEQCKMTLKEFAGALQTTPEKLLQFLKKLGYIYEDGNICGKRNKNGNGEVLYMKQDGCYFFNQEFLKRFRKN